MSDAGDEAGGSGGTTNLGGEPSAGGTSTGAMNTGGATGGTASSAPMMPETPSRFFGVGASTLSPSAGAVVNEAPTRAVMATTIGSGRT